MQWVVHLTQEPEVLGSIPGPTTYVCSPSADLRSAVVSYWRKYVHKVLINRLEGLSLPRKSVVRLTDFSCLPWMKTTTQHDNLEAR